jgi:hypothetical protein
VVVRYTHDIPLAELDGQHAKSLDCPCGTDVEQVTPNSAIVYHQRRTTRVERILADAERVAAHKRDSGRPL